MFYKEGVNFKFEIIYQKNSAEVYLSERLISGTH